MPQPFPMEYTLSIPASHSPPQQVQCFHLPFLTQFTQNLLGLLDTESAHAFSRRIPFTASQYLFIKSRFKSEYSFSLSSSSFFYFFLPLTFLLLLPSLLPRFALNISYSLSGRFFGWSACVELPPRLSSTCHSPFIPPRLFTGPLSALSSFF